MGFLNIIPCFYFSLEAVLQGMPKINPTKKKEIQTTLKHIPACELTEEKMLSNRYKSQR